MWLAKASNLNGERSGSWKSSELVNFINTVDSAAGERMASLR